MECGMERAEMREFGVGGQIQKFDSPRQLEPRRRGEQEIIGQREDSATRANLGRVVVVIVARRLLRLRGFGVRSSLGKGRGNGEIGVGQPALHGRRRLHGGCPVEMPERQRKLDRERKQRQPRAKFEMFSKPIHGALRSPGTAQALQTIPMLLYNMEDRLQCQLLAPNKLQRSAILCF